MTNNFDIYLTIFGMAAVTYLTRISGFFISDRIKNMPPLFEQTLQYIPGTIIVSIIAPQIILGGVDTIIAAVVCFAAALFFNNMIAVMATGIVVVSVLRNFIFI